jgi:hypothetical protein
MSHASKMPDSSLIAFREGMESGNFAGQRAMLKEAIRRHPNLTRAEYGFICNWTGNLVKDSYTARRRMSDLKKAGEVVVPFLRHSTVLRTKFQVECYCLTEMCQDLHPDLYFTPVKAQPKYEKVEINELAELRRQANLVPKLQSRIDQLLKEV